MTNTERVRERFKRYRKKFNRTLRELAPLVGLALGTLSRFENGHDIKATTLDKISEWLTEVRK